MIPLIQSISDSLIPHFSAILPVSEIADYISTHPDDLEKFVAEFDLAVAEFKKFRRDTSFPNRKLFLNSYEFNTIYQHDLPNFSEIVPPQSVFIELSTDKYFNEVWQIKSIKSLVINLILLTYRTTILHQHRSVLYDRNGRRLVQISCTIEEMVFSLHLAGQTLEIFSTLSPWLSDWQGEGFSQSLHDLVLK